jgi:hypothetical protein
MRQEHIKADSSWRSVESAEPAVGIIVNESTIDPSIRTVMRARERDLTVFVVDGTDSDVIADVLDYLGAVLVEVTDETERTHRDHLVDVAREHDCAGIVIHEGSRSIDFEASLATFEQGSAYAIEPSVSSESGLLVGIPAYNEEIGIGSTVLGAKRYADEVVVVDDGSEDRTVEVARTTGATVLEHETNHGKGRALNTFFTYARSTDHEEFVVLDGDGQHVPADIPKVVEPVRNGEADVVVGSRYLGERCSETPRYRRVGQRVLDALTVGSSGENLTDTQSGFRAFSPAAVDALTLRTDGMGVETEMIGTAVDSDLELVEVPIDVRYEGIDGQTFNPVYHGIGVAAFTLQLIRDRHPLLFFGMPGVAMTGAGVGAGLFVVTAYQQAGQFLLGWVLLSSFLSIVGVLGVFCALILNRISNMITELGNDGR